VLQQQPLRLTLWLLCCVAAAASAADALVTVSQQLPEGSVGGQEMQLGPQKGGKLCLAPGCLRRRAYGFPTTLDHVNSHNSTCSAVAVEDMCAARSTCIPSMVPAHVISKPQFCAQHKVAGQLNLMTRRCSAAGCIKTASFGPPHPAPSARALLTKKRPNGVVQLWRCALHRVAGDVDLRSSSKKCAFVGCAAQGSFSLTNSSRALYCKTHRDVIGDASIDRKNRKCAHVNCPLRASFGISAPRLVPLVCLRVCVCARECGHGCECQCQCQCQCQCVCTRACVRVCARARVRMCMCVRVRVRAPAHCSGKK